MKARDTHFSLPITNFNFVDRAQGGSSIKSGQIELMLLRQTINDDGRGVDEPLNDPGQFGKGLIVKGKHLLHFIPPTNSKGLNVNARKQQQLYGTLIHPMMCLYI